MSLIKKIAATASAFCIVMSLTSCADTSWASKVEDSEVRAGIHIYNTALGYWDAYTKLTEDQRKGDFFKQKIENVDTKDYILDYATSQSKEFVVINSKFDELELELSSSDKRIINNNLDRVWTSFEDILTDNGISKQSVKDVLTTNYKRDLIFKKYYAANGIEAVAQEDINDYLVDNYTTYKQIKFSLRDSEGNLLKDAEKKTVMELAEKYKARFEAGEDFDELIAEYTESQSTSTDDSTSDDSEVDESTPDSSSDSDSDTSSDVDEDENKYINQLIANIEGTTPSTKFITSLFKDAKIGEPVILQEDEAYYLVLKGDILQREDIIEDSDTIESLLYEYKGEDFSEKIEEWSADLSFEKNDAAYKRYDPEKFDEDFLTSFYSMIIGYY